jgi:tRNA-splicing ligase RtcB
MKKMYAVNNKLYNWASQIDPNALVQAERSARLPIVERVALMPDAHLGIGATVGSVIGTKGAIIPAAVGVDIGCGMIGYQLDIKADDLGEDLDQFMPAVEMAIPAGLGKDHNGRTSIYADRWLTEWNPKFSTKLDQKLQQKILNQYGTLGSGNHFFEICLDEADQVWFVIHSGSRGIGNILAKTHIEAAKKVCTEKGIKLEDKDLAYLEENDQEFTFYIDDLLACQDYARANRAMMMAAVLKSFEAFIGRQVKIIEAINCHHNYTEQETHEGSTVWVTRKGAIRAGVDDRGIIPGSMGTSSYIVQGLGNPLSYESCAHGAGRMMSRGQAKRTFDVEELRKLMEGKIWNETKAQSLVDEIPGAYKDIHAVMEDQKDLVETTHVLRQIFNYKGT